MLMGAGVAVAALGSATAYIAKTLAETSWLAILMGVLGAILLVLIPTAIIAFFKLRRRDLSAIREGSGWAVNTRMRLTSKQGRFFTERPPCPHGAIEIKRLFWRRVLWLTLAALLLVLLVNHIRQHRGPEAPPPPPARAAEQVAPRGPGFFAKSALTAGFMRAKLSSFGLTTRLSFIFDPRIFTRRGG